MLRLAWLRNSDTAGVYRSTYILHSAGKRMITIIYNGYVVSEKICLLSISS